MYKMNEGEGLIDGNFRLIDRQMIDIQIDRYINWYILLRNEYSKHGFMERTTGI